MQFLVIARAVKGTSQEQFHKLVKPEATKVWEMVVADRIRSIHYVADFSAAVLLFEAADFAEVSSLMAQFPMMEAGLLHSETLPLKPYTGFSQLFTAP